MRPTDRRLEWRYACFGGWLGITLTGSALLDSRMLAVLWIYACVITGLLVWAIGVYDAAKQPAEMATA